jgi:hypothetical protein
LFFSCSLSSLLLYYLHFPVWMKKQAKCTFDIIPRCMGPSSRQTWLHRLQYNEWDCCTASLGLAARDVGSISPQAGRVSGAGLEHYFLGGQNRLGRTWNTDVQENRERAN